MKTLREAAIGSTVRVVRINGEGAIKRRIMDMGITRGVEIYMNSRKWTWFAIGYECAFAYLVAFAIYQIGSMFAGYGNVIGFILGLAVVAFGVYMLARKPKEA